MAEQDPDTTAKPLATRRILVTRSAHQSRDFSAALSDLGADVLSVPTIAIMPPTEPGPLLEAVRDVQSFDWVVFTSVNGVEGFWKAMEAGKVPGGGLEKVSVCAVGKVTADALIARGVEPAFTPKKFIADALVEFFRRQGELGGVRFMLPRAETARQVLPDELRRQGADVRDVAAYRTVPDPAAGARMQELMKEAELDMVTFASSSAVRNLTAVWPSAHPFVPAASIGPVTSLTARALGWNVAVEATVHTSDGLCSAIAEFYGETLPNRAS